MNDKHDSPDRECLHGGEDSVSYRLDRRRFLKTMAVGAAALAPGRVVADASVGAERGIMREKPDPTISVIGSSNRDARDLAAVETLAARVIDSARLTADDGTILYAPDGNIYYRGIWSRDFCYLAEGAGPIVPDDHVRDGFEFMIRRQRADGGMPSAVVPSGQASYVCVGDSATQTDGDNSQFMVKLAEEYRRRTDSSMLFERHLDALARGMDFVPREKDGLVWIDPKHPHTGYGFRDVMGVKGADTFCSLLYWEAASILARAARELHRAEMADKFSAQARQIENNLHRLIDPATGVFIAGEDAERHVDVWANAYFVYLGVPLPELRKRVLDFLVQNRDDYLQDGQVRHLLKGQSWDRVNCYVMPEGTYQNGAYWATASGWVLAAFLEADADLARATADALAKDFLTRGVYECVNRGFLWGGHGVEYTKVPNYVASIANPLPLIRRIYRT